MNGDERKTQAETLERYATAIIKNIAQRCQQERAPYPPGHLVSLARPVHYLAARAMSDTHPAGAGNNRTPAAWRFRDYLHSVFSLNDTIDRAAKAGRLKLRHPLSGAVLDFWHLPEKAPAGAWEQALLRGNTAQAIQLMPGDARWPLMQPHFIDVTVSPAEFFAWVEAEGIAAPGEVARLMAEGETALRENMARAERMAAIEEGREPPSMAHEARQVEPKTGSNEAQGKGQDDSAATWQDKARQIADELHRKDKAGGGYTTNRAMADRVASEAIKRGITGQYGQLTAGNILREALQGGRWKRPKD